MTTKKNKKTLAGITLLLVEDDDFLAEILNTKLTEDGGILTVSTNATQALRSIEQSIPDVVVTDLMLPGMSGEELIESIKGDDRYAHIPIIVFSNKNNPVDIKNLLKRGVAEYHVKAETSLKDIPKIIERVVEKHSK